MKTSIPKLAEDALPRKRRGASPPARQAESLRPKMDEASNDFAADPFAPIRPAEPLRVEAAPTTSDAERTIAIYPAAQGQLQMWFLQQYAPKSPYYNIPMAFRLEGRLDLPRLEQAFHAVLWRHGALRTTFVMEEGNLVQCVASSLALNLHGHDLARTPPAQRENAASERIEAMACRPFDLTNEPLIRVELFRLHECEHLLALVVHHIVFDGWSQVNFCRELSAYYATGESAKAALPSLPIEFADYSAWQDQRLRVPEFAEQYDYWQAKLGGELEPLDLPRDRARPTVSSYRGDNRSLALDSDLLAALKTRAQAEGVTLFMILLAAFKVLLFRHTAREDLRVGIPFANRQRAETEGMLGFFVNTLVMRTPVTGEVTFRELLQRVKRTAIEAFTHSELPFEKLVEMFAGRFGNDRPVLVETLFVLQTLPEPSLTLDDLQVTPWPVHTHTAKVDLTLFMNENAGDWTATAEYSTDLFDAERIDRLLGHWRVLLESIVAQPAARVAELPMLTPSERQRLLVDWNETARDYPREKSVHQLFAEQAAATPVAIALVAGGSAPLTYHELNERADRLASHLQDAGVRRGDLVGLSVERSIEMVVALLGILKAGGAYWAIEENLPDERRRTLLADARPRLVLARKSSADQLAHLIEKSGAGCRVVALEDLLAAPAMPLRESVAVGADDPVYVSYTSGSTGRPKGVLVPHRGVVRLVKNADYVSLDARETILQMAPLSFDASTFELWGALLNGGRVVLMPPGPPSLAQIGAAIRDGAVTTLWLTAGLFHLMVEQRLEDLKPLRQLLAGGDVLSPEHLRKVRRALPHCRVINGYGPTENTTFTCCYPVMDERDLATSVPIGKPIANTQVYVLDGSQQPVPIGVEGELYAGGDGVALGYLNEPQLTAERFVSDPFSARPDGRLYRTGDRVRWRADGNLEFHGRLDSEIKIRGYRVDLGEIETRLRDCSGIREALVIRDEESSGDGRLIAYVVLDEGADIPVESLREHTRNCLPDYMIPGAFVILERLPLLSNGKIDRRHLPAPAAARENLPNEQQQPLNLLEVGLTEIWRSLFHRRHIGRQENFFELGGHSLLAARLMAEIDDRFGCNLPIAALFHAPTIETLSRRLTEEDCAPLWTSLVPLQPEGTRPPLFFTHGWGGDVFCFQPLARLLPPEQPSYGLQAVGLDGKALRHTSVEEMAAHYVQEIRSFQPEGPYYVGGYSMGGLIAFEIAQQLFQTGQRVAMVALLDTARQPAPWTVFARTLAPFFRERSKVHFERLHRMSTVERFHYFGHCVFSFYKWLTRNRANPAVITAGQNESDQTAVLPKYGDYYVAVASAYRLRRYPGSIDVFVSDTADAKFVSIWRHLARRGAKVHRVPGDHFEIMGIKGSHQLPVLAQALTSALEDAQRASSGRD